MLSEQMQERLADAASGLPNLNFDRDETNRLLAELPSDPDETLRYARSPMTGMQKPPRQNYHHGGELGRRRAQDTRRSCLALEGRAIITA
jgi:hypothetical protein